MRLLVINMQAGVDTVLDNSGLEAAGRTFGDLTFKEQLYSIRTTLIQVVSNNFLEELSSPQWSVKDLGQANFQLPNRKTMEVTSP